MLRNRQRHPLDVYYIYIYNNMYMYMSRVSAFQAFNSPLLHTYPLPSPPPPTLASSDMYIIPRGGIMLGGAPQVDIM